MDECPHCGQRVGPADAYCGNCGAPLRLGTPVEVQGGRASAAPTEQLVTPDVACPSCRRAVAASATICPHCGYELTPATPPAQQQQVAPGLETDGMRPLIPGTSIALGDGETVWRRYLVTGYPRFELFGIPITRSMGSGTLYVTNSRLLFFAFHQQGSGRRRSLLIQETQLEHVTGLTAYVSRRFNLFAVIVAALLIIGAIYGLIHSSAATVVIFGAAAVIAVLLLMQGMASRGGVGLRVHSGAAEASPIGFGRIGTSPGLFRALLAPFAGPSDAGDMLMALPGPDAERVIVELGALIADLQSKGNLAETHWGVDGGARGGAPAGQARGF